MPGRMRGVPRVVTVATSLGIGLKEYVSVAGLDPQSWLRPRHLIHAVAPDFLYRKLLARADALICWSEYVERRLQVVGVPEDRIRRTPPASIRCACRYARRRSIA